MKSCVLTYLLTSLFIISTQAQTYHFKQIPYPVESLARQLDAEAKTDTITIYELNDDILKELISYSKNEYHLLVLYADWCKPCLEKMDSLRLLGSDYNQVSFYFFSADKHRRVPVIADYMRRKNIYTPTFILSEVYKRNVKRRFIRFREQVCPDCDEILGFPSFILFDKEMNVLFKNTAEVEALESYLKQL